MKRLKIGDCTLRDGQQSLLATRLRTQDITSIAGEMDKAGFYAIDVSADFLFEISIRFLNEDPWERIRTLKKLMPNTPFRLTQRGRTLAGWRVYPDDVISAYFRHAAEVGIDIFRLYDTLNEERNFEVCTRVIKECGKQIQGEIIYALTEDRLGGPIYNLEYYIGKARAMQEMGADSICLTDSPGILAPYDAYELVKALKKALDIPVVLHSHYLSGMASMSYLKAIEAGVDIIDTCLAPLSLRSSLPAVEPFLMALKGTAVDPGLDLGHLHRVGQYFESVLISYRDWLDNTRLAPIDTGILMHQLPGGMNATLVNQLKEMNALEKLPQVRDEVARVRKEMGSPPLVTPLAQILATQAVQNVLAGRYKIISRQVKDYVAGLYGRSPAPVDPGIQKIVPKNETYASDYHPEPELEKAMEAVKDITEDIGDVLLYALYPTYGMKFLRLKHGLDKS